MSSTAEPRNWSLPSLAWGFCGVLLAATFVLLWRVGPYVGLSEMERAGVTPAMACTLAAGLIYAVAVWLGPPATGSSKLILFLVTIALLMRAAMFLVPARPGVDYNRYFWDGAMTAHGLNPYQYSPQDLLTATAPNPVIQDLLDAGGKKILERTNHPELATIYPPVSQVAFALGYRITPFGITGWRIVLLLFDLGAALLVWSLLRMARAPAGQWAIYLWNPLLVLEIYHNAHLDMIMGALVLFYLWCLSRERYLEAGTALALGAGAKLWPAFLGMFLVRRAWGQKRRLMVSLAVAGLLSAVILVPYLMALFQASSGLGAYAKGSHDNFLAHDWISWVAEIIVKLSGSDFSSDRLARLITAPLLAAVAIHQGLRSGPSILSLGLHAGAFILIMLLVSPTVYPWYFVPLVPLAAVTRQPFLVLAVILPLLFNFPRALIADRLLQWLVHGPLWLALGLHGFRAWKRGPEPMPESAPEPGPASTEGNTADQAPHP